MIKTIKQSNKAQQFVYSIRYSSDEYTTQKEMNDILSHFYDQRKGVIKSKRTQYSDRDVLQNFRQRAVMESRTVEGVILSDMDKHVQAIAKAVRDGKLSAEWWTPGDAEGVGQKLGDLANYVELLYTRAVELDAMRKQALRDEMKKSKREG